MKTISLEAAKQAATPGKLSADGCTVLAPSGWLAARDDFHLGASETVHFCSTDENHRPHSEQEANAALLVHRWNTHDELIESTTLYRELAKHQLLVSEQG